MPKTKIKITNESKYVSPMKVFKTIELRTLHEFFQYKAVNPSDSPLHLQNLAVLTNAQKETLWQRMLDSIKAQQTDFIFALFLQNVGESIQTIQLTDDTLVCDKAKGFIQQPKALTKVDALLKRMRDSFAHGRIAKAGEYLIFEDKQNELTGRVVLTIQQLQTWKSTIEQFLDECETIDQSA